MTFVWFVVWLIFDRVGDREPLLLDPVNIWTLTLLGAIALDVNRQDAMSRGRRRR